jgi:hypothetical protein
LRRMVKGWSIRSRVYGWSGSRYRASYRSSG